MPTMVPTAKPRNLPSVHYKNFDVRDSQCKSLYLGKPAFLGYGLNKQDSLGKKRDSGGESHEGVSRTK